MFLLLVRMLLLQGTNQPGQARLIHLDARFSVSGIYGARINPIWPTQFRSANDPMSPSDNDLQQ